jgi:prevent-host-death family protein
MITITAKELRDNLEEYVKRTKRGESIKVTYRSKPAFTLLPEKSTNSVLPGSKKAMKIFLEETRKLRNSKRQSVFDPNKSVKELYHEMLDNDPKYRPPYHR